MNFYRAVATGLNKRQLIKYDESYQDSLNQLINKSPLQDYYESIYCYDDSHLEHFKKTKSLSGIKNVKTDRIVFDFDSKSDVEQARLDAVEVANRLIESGVKEEAIQTYWSGNKGFHVILQLADGEMIDRKQFEKYINHFASDLTTFDHKVKDEQRILRIPLTRHNATGLYKVPMSVEQLRTSTIEEIKEASNGEYDFSDAKWENTSLKDIAIPEQKKEILTKEYLTFDKPNMADKPKFLTPAKWVLQNGFFEEGERNEACLIIASTYKFFNFDKETTYNILKATLRLRAQRLNLPDYDKSELWNTIIEVVYSNNWRGGTFDESDGLLARTIKRYNLKESIQEKGTITIQEGMQRFLDFAKNIDKNTVKMGVEELDRNVLITTGMMVGYLGAPSSGKTSQVLSFLENQSVTGNAGFFQSADMSVDLLMARLIQRECGMSFQKILDIIKVSNYPTWPKNLKEAYDQAILKFKNIGFSFQSGPTIEDCSRLIDEHEQRTGLKVKLFGMDYLEKMRCEISDATSASGYNASRLADLTKEKDMATILLLQPQKSAGDVSDDLLSMRKIKGASVIEQDCRVIMTTWRPGFNPDNEGENYDDVYTSIAIVKNNMGNTLRMNFSWDGAKGRIRSLTSDEQNDFKRVVEENRARKAGTQGEDLF